MDQNFQNAFWNLQRNKNTTFQYRITHTIIPLNKWLYYIKIKDNKIYDYCRVDDSITHCLIKCTNTKEIWKIWFRLWRNISQLDISNFNYIVGSILIGVPANEEIFEEINYCILMAKYYNYIQKLVNYFKIDLHQYLVMLIQKRTLEILICIYENKITKFNKFCADHS